MTRTRLVRLAVAAAVTAALAASAPAPAHADGTHVRLHPIDGGHWQAGTGLPDATGAADHGLVSTVGDPTPQHDAHPEVAAILGLHGAPTSEIHSIGFAVRDERGSIVPCIRVAHTDPAGNDAEVMITRSQMRPYVIETLDADWHGWRFEGTLPPGTVQAIELGVHVDDPNFIDNPDLVVFDDIELNDHVWTSPDDNAVG